jgi:aminopeptidase N
MQHCLIKKLLTAFLFSFISFSAWAAGYPRFTHADSVRGSMNAARMYDVHFYDLNILVDPSKKTIAGSNIISFTTMAKLDSIQIDLSRNFQILAINFTSGEQLKYYHRDDRIIVFLDHPLKKDTSLAIQVHYLGKPVEAKNAPWDGGFVWTHDSLGREWTAVACEGIGASCWWPCKDYLGDEPDSMHISCQVPEGEFCISNGRMTKIDNMMNGFNRFDWYVNYPINTYDVTVNIGSYDHIHDTFNSKAGKLDVDYYVLDYHMNRAKDYFNAQVKPMLRCFEHYFGPYPFTKDGYALVEDPYWGMEHQEAVAYGNHFKLNEFGFDFIIVHESGHEWWGNSLSCKDEAEMWLHESFTTYAEALYVEYYQGKEKARDYLAKQRTEIRNMYPMIGPKGVNFHDRVDNDIYYKGTWMLHTLRSIINNDSLWFNILYTFQQQHKYHIITTEQFIAHVDSLTGTKYDTYFDQFLNHAQPPMLIFNAEQKGSKVQVTYQWSKAMVPGLYMPVDIVDGNGNKVRVYPTAEPQKLKIKNATAANVKPDERNFYITWSDRDVAPMANP